MTHLSHSAPRSRPNAPPVDTYRRSPPLGRSRPLVGLARAISADSHRAALPRDARARVCVRVRHARPCVCVRVCARHARPPVCTCVYTRARTCARDARAHATQDREAPKKPPGFSRIARKTARPPQNPRACARPGQSRRITRPRARTAPERERPSPPAAHPTRGA